MLAIRPPNSPIFLLIPFFLLLYFQNARTADVYCYTGGGNTASNGSTLSLQNICLGNDSCFLVINSDYTWRSGCIPPLVYANLSSYANISNQQTYCQPAANSQPGFCRCNTHFCNTPNNPNFFASLNGTLSDILKIVKPSDSGNLTCFECGNPVITLANGTRTLSTMNVNCDGTKFCTGKYCITRRSSIPRSYCATSWEDTKTLACQKLSGDQYDDQECICQQSFCNYPYDPLNTTTPAPTTAMTTTPMATTTPVATTTMNNALPPGNWQCMNSCNASGITLTKDSTNATKLDASFFESPMGCQKVMVTCTSSAYSTVFFGNQGGLIAFQPNYTSVQALLYCIRNNNTNVWTRFGTTQDPNAQLTVNEAHCLVSASNNTNTSSTATTGPPTTQSTAPPPTSTLPPTAATAAPPPPGLFQCMNTCNAGQIAMSSDANALNFTAASSEAPAGCGKILLQCTVRNPTLYAVIEFGPSARDGGLIANQPNFTSVQALVYCIKHNNGNGNESRWIRFGISSDPNAMVPVNQARCNSYAGNIIPTVSPTTTMPPPTGTSTTTTMATTTMRPTSPPVNPPMGPWACVPGCNASQLATTADPSGRSTIRADFMPANSSTECSKMRVTCTSNTMGAAVGFGTQGNIVAFLPNFTSVTAELHCLRNNNTLSWTRFGTSRDPNAMFSTIEAHCEMANLTDTTTAAPTTSTSTTTTSRPPSTPAPTNATMPPTTPPPTTATMPPSTTTVSVNQSLPPGPWQCLTGCNANQIVLTRDTTNQTTMTSNGTFEAPQGCAKLMVTCSAPPSAVVGFGTQGGLMAFQPNYNSVSALLYCIRNNGSLVWTRFGTTRDPNAMLTVTEAHCEVGPPPTLMPSTPPLTNATMPPPSTPPSTPPPTTTTMPPSTPPPTTTTTPTTTPPSTTTSITRPPSTPIPTNATLPPTTAAPSAAAPSTAAPSTAAPSTAAPSTAAPSTAAPSTAAPSTAAPTTAAPTTAAPTTAAPTTAAPTTAAPTTAAPSTAAPTTAAPTTAAPTTPPPTTVTPTTLPLTTTTSVNNALPPGLWQCVMGCNASQVVLSAGPSGMPTFQSMAPNAGPIVTPTFEAPAGCTKLLVNCAATTPAAMVMFGPLGNLTAFQPNYMSVSALLYCIRNNGSLVWTRFGTTRDPNAMLTVTQASCGLDAIPTAATPTMPPQTLAPTNATIPPSTATTPASTPPPTTMAPSTPPPTTMAPSTPPPTTMAPSTPPPTTMAPSTPPPTTMAPSTPPPTTTTSTMQTTQQPQANPNGSVIVCPDGRKFGPNELAVRMAKILKESMMNGLGNSGNALSAVKNFQDGINTHICNYM